jgi:hypothetical protein
VFCIEESVWTDRLGLADEMSVRPTLELLKRIRMLDQFVHRHALTVREFESYLAWRQDRLTKTFGTVYFAFHGNSDGLFIGSEVVPLDRLAHWLGPLPGGVVHLGSCAVLKNREEEARRFLKQTQARLISGYDRNVDWLDSAALETAWLGDLAGPGRVGDIVRRFSKRYASLIDHLSWVAYY